MEKQYGLLGVPTSLGAAIIGTEKAPDAIRKHLNVVNHRTLKDCGDVVVKTCPVGDKKKKRFGCIKKNNDAVASEVRNILKDKRMPILLGGDHSITIGGVRGVVGQYGHIGLIYIDAHGDYNTATTSPSGNVHGMVVSEISRSEHCELSCNDALVSEQHIVLIGVRDLDQQEKDRLLASRITVFTMDMVRRLGIDAVMKKALRIVSNRTKGYYCSLDIDALDPRIAPGTGYNVAYGFKKKEIMRIVDYISHGRLLAFDIVEVNPKKDVEDKTTALVAAIAKKIMDSQ
jgi:arginase